MQRKEVSLEEAIEHLNLVSKETPEGTSLYWGSDSDKEGQAVTFEESETEKGRTQAHWKVVKATLSNSAHLRDFYAKTFRSWSAVSENLAKFPKIEAPVEAGAEKVADSEGTSWEAMNNSLPKHTASKITVAEAAELLELDVLYTVNGAEFIDSDGEEVTLETANRTINDSQLALEAAANSDMIGGTQYWHKRNIETWSVIRDLLENKES